MININCHDEPVPISSSVICFLYFSLSGELLSGLSQDGQQAQRNTREAQRPFSEVLMFESNPGSQVKQNRIKKIVKGDFNLYPIYK